MTKINWNIFFVSPRNISKPITHIIIIISTNISQDPINNSSETQSTIYTLIGHK